MSVDFDELGRLWRDAEAEWESQAAEKCAAADPDARLWQTLVTFEAVMAHMEEGGSYRYLIYERLGFGPDTYGVLLGPGMGLSNWISEHEYPDFRLWWRLTKTFWFKRVSIATRNWVRWYGLPWATACYQRCVDIVLRKVKRIGG